MLIRYCGGVEVKVEMVAGDLNQRRMSGNCLFVNLNLEYFLVVLYFFILV